MNILAIDTSTNVSTVAVTTEKKLLAEVIMQLKIPQSEVLLSHLKEALAIARLSVKDIDAIAVSVGPGSFTGLRIGLTTAKMLAYALNLPIYTTSSLRALAYHYPVEGIYAASTLDAQKGNAYVEIYSYNPLTKTMDIVEEVKVENFVKILEHCNSLDKKVKILGDIAQNKADLITPENYPNVELAPFNACMPRSSDVALACLPDIRANRHANIMDLEPWYIRRSEAEVLWEKRQKEQKHD